MNDLLDPVRSGTYTPAKVSDGIISAYRSRVADALHSITSNGAHGGRRVAQTHVHRICRMAKMVDARACPVLMSAKVVVWRGRQSQSRCCHSLTRGLVGNDRKAVGQAKKTARGSSERVSGNPDVSIGIQRSDVVVEILNGVVVAVLPLLLDVLHQASRVAAIGRRHAVTDL